MIIEPLLALSGAPDLNALLDKPLYHEGSFIVASAQTVKHENQ